MIIKNCPAFMSNQNNCCTNKTQFAECKKNNNCIMKQIVIALRTRTPEDNEKILNILEVEE